MRELEFVVDLERIFAHGYREERYAFWLDGNLDAEGLGRWSFLGGHPRFLLRTKHGVTEWISKGEQREIQAEPFTAIQQVWSCFKPAELPEVAKELPFIGGFVGYFGYEMVQHIESVPVHESDVPDAWWMFVDRVLIWDRLKRKAFVIDWMFDDDPAEVEEREKELEAWIKRLKAWSETPVPSVGSDADGEWDESLFRASESYATYVQKLGKIREHILRGDIYQACFTYPIQTSVQVDPFDLYRVLRKINPAPFSAFVRFGNLAVVSSSPERFLKLDLNGRVESRPIKGTRPRSMDPAKDEQQKQDLKESVKDRAENVMIVDLVRNDLGRVSQTGTVHVPALFQVESYATVHQLVSIIEGRLREGTSSTDVIRAAFPGGSMTGAPKIRAMEILHGLESGARGIYSGGLGYLDVRGAFDLSMVIRTIVCQNGLATFHVGGGIVADSEPEREYQETLDKALALKRAIALAHRELILK